MTGQCLPRLGLLQHRRLLLVSDFTRLIANVGFEDFSRGALGVAKVLRGSGRGSERERGREGSEREGVRGRGARGREGKGVRGREGVRGRKGGSEGGV